MPQKLRPSYQFNAEQLEQLKSIVPEAFKDGMLDFNSLYDALSAYNEEDSLEMDDNFYGLYWPGKRQAKRAASIPPRGTLVPVKGDGVDEDKTNNIYIEGDNLEVLKLLQKSYAGKIKMIYIDPPYNTGNDFIYNDDFSETAEAFGKAAGQIDEQGVKQTTNTRADGRFHSKWLTMMYPRLKLAHRLLSDDGVIFISISDSEVNHLMNICHEIFGDENFCGDIIWNSTKSVTNTALISVSHTYNLVYFKNANYFIERREEFRLPDDGSGFENPDNDPRGSWKADPFQVGGWRPNQQYVIKNPNTGVEYRPNPGCSWKNDHDKFQELLADNRIVFGKTGEGGPQRKRFVWEAKERGKVVKTLWDDVETTTNGTQTLKKIFDDISVFDNPKPIGLIQRFLQLGTNDNSIILDFFSGSSTTAHAVMQLNAEDSGNRKYIMVQWPEKCDKKSEAFNAGFKNICEIGKERIRRAGRNIRENMKQISNHQKELIPPPVDTGFKVYRLAPSNYKKWQNYTGTDIKEAEGLFAQYENPLVDNWKEDDLLTEIMLTEGFPMDSIVTVINDFKKNKVTRITSDFCEHALFVCLDKTINAETINTLVLSEHDIFICLDNAVTDQDKARLDDKGLIKTI